MSGGEPRCTLEEPHSLFAKGYAFPASLFLPHTAFPDTLGSAGSVRGGTLGEQRAPSPAGLARRASSSTECGSGFTPPPGGAAVRRRSAVGQRVPQRPTRPARGRNGGTSAFPLLPAVPFRVSAPEVSQSAAWILPLAVNSLIRAFKHLRLN